MNFNQDYGKDISLRKNFLTTIIALSYNGH